MRVRKGCYVLVIGCVALLAIVGLLVAGCSGSSTTTAASAPAGTETAVAATTTTAAAERFVVGGEDQYTYQAAIPELQKKLEATPKDTALLQDLAVAQYNLKQYDDAIKTYEKMLSIEDKPVFRNNYANVLRDSGKLDLAVEQYQKAIAGDSTNAVFYINLASVFVRQQKMDEALKVLDQGIAAVQGEGQKRLESYKSQLTTKQ